jgi:hypothetical protein
MTYISVRRSPREHQSVSYDINFWKQEHPLVIPPVEIYRALCRGEAVTGLAILPVDQILQRLTQVFPSFDPANQFPLVRTSNGSIEFWWSQQHFRFDLRGICGECQNLVNVMREFECPMYDPQVNRRYDAQQGMALGDAPKFEDPPTPEQAERIIAEALAKLQGGRL